MRSFSLLSALALALLAAVAHGSDPVEVHDGGNSFCKTSDKCSACQADCDEHSHCEDGLLCHDRETGEDTYGCSGLDVEENGRDYCVEGGTSIAIELEHAGTTCLSMADKANFLDHTTEKDKRMTARSCAFMCHNDGYGQFMFGASESKCGDDSDPVEGEYDEDDKENSLCTCRCPAGITSGNKCSSSNRVGNVKFDLYTITGTADCHFFEAEENAGAEDEEEAHHCTPTCRCSYGQNVDCEANDECAGNNSECLENVCTDTTTGEDSTKFPTAFPTINVDPTFFPSRRPTGNPTGFPTRYPSEFPTSRPTRYPTGFPTREGCCTCPDRRLGVDAKGAPMYDVDALRKTIAALEDENKALKESNAALKEARGHPAVRGA